MMFEIVNLDKRYEKNAPLALDNISYASNNDKPIGLIGSNGAGKTTLFMIANGLTRPSSGDIIIGGYYLSKDLNAIKRCTGLFTDKLLLYPVLSVKESIKYFLGVYRISYSKYDYWAGMFGVKEYENKKISELSTGMLKRLLLLISLINSPKVLFLDEPFSGLDPLAKNDLVQLINNLYNNNKVKIIISSHDMQETQAIVKEVMIMEKGKIIEHGNYADLLKKYNRNKTFIVKYISNASLSNTFVDNIIRKHNNIIMYEFDNNTFYKFMNTVNKSDIIDISSRDMSLDDIYREVRRNVI